MTTTIERTLSKLAKQSELERSGKSQAASGEEMLAITYDTGKLFEILLIAMKAKRILEIGTSVGYSTLWFANALVYNNSMESINIKPIITVEMNPSKIKRASENFAEAGVENLIEVLEGNAKTVLHNILKDFKRTEGVQKTDRLFDFIFLDADKECLTEYFDMVLPMLRIGGIIATDNMLYPEEYRGFMSEYANYIRSNNSVKTVTVAIGNGEELTTKLS
ncbi:MAG TPA: O-methyltransferase [Nitrososphaeraceae archaeon]